VVSTKTKGVHTTISLDLAKDVIQVCQVSKHGGDKALRSVLYQGALAVISRLPDVPKTRKQQ